jgi:hypothetical protein
MSSTVERLSKRRMGHDKLKRYVRSRDNRVNKEIMITSTHGLYGLSYDMPLSALAERAGTSVFSQWHLDHNHASRAYVRSKNH